MLKHIAAVCTAAVLAAAGSWGAAAASPAAPAPTEHRPVTLHATISPATGHHARTCADGGCTAMAVPDPAPATVSAAVAPRTDAPAVTRSDCPNAPGAGYRIDTPGAAPLLALALDSRPTHAAVRADPDRPRSASACAG